MPRVEDTIQTFGSAWRSVLDHVNPDKHEFHKASNVLREPPAGILVGEGEEDEEAEQKRSAAAERAVINQKINDIQGQRVDLYKELKRFFDDLNAALDKTVENERARPAQLRELNDLLTALTEAVTRYNEALHIDPDTIDDEDGFPRISNIPTKDNFSEEQDNVVRARKEYNGHFTNVSFTYPRLRYNKKERTFHIDPLELSPTSDPEHPDYIKSILSADEIKIALQNEVYKLICLIMTQDIAEQSARDPRNKAPLTIDEGSKEVVTEYITYLLLLERDLNLELSKFDQNDLKTTLDALLIIFKKHEEQRNALFSKMAKLDSLTLFFKSVTSIIIGNVTTTYGRAFNCGTLVCNDSLKFSEWLSSWFFLAVDPSKGKEKFENFLTKRLAYLLVKVATQYKKETFTAQVLQLQDNDLDAYLKFINKTLTENHFSDYKADSRAYILITTLAADPDLRDVVFDRLPPFTEGGSITLDSWVRGVIKRHLRNPGSYNPYTSIKSAPAPTTQTTPPRMSPAPSSTSLASADAPAVIGDAAAGPS